jgi:uncharacterized protein
MTTSASFNEEFQFSLSAKPGTDIWRKPPTTNIFCAPVYPHPEYSSPFPLRDFKSTRITFAPTNGWSVQYDHGGVLLTLTPNNKSEKKQMWLKAGGEFYNGVPRISSVGCDTWADWSLYPINPGETTYTIEARREGDENGKSLWLYKIDNVGGRETKLPLREVCWFFADEENWDIMVEAFAARPKVPPEGEKEELEVAFRDFRVEKN